ncbi:MAG: thiol reductant ABC exporter subunit CydD, partial [Anaerolineaceae bacterium]
RALMTFCNEVSTHAVARGIKTSLRLELFDHLFKLGPSVTQNEQTAGLSTTALAGVESLEAYYSQFLPQLVLAALIPLAILLFVFPRDLLSGSVLLVTAPLLPLFMILIGRASERLTNHRWAALGRLSHFFLDTLQGLTTLKLFGQSRGWSIKLGDAGERYRTATMNVLRVTFLSALALELIATLSTAVVAVEIGLRLLYGRLDYQPALMILLLAPEFYLPLRLLGQRFHASRSGLSAAARIVEILALKPPVENEPDKAVHSFKTAPIAFKSVSVNYPERDRPALQDVSFEIAPGERVAIVGESGAGKSTLFNVLLRFIHTASGQITADGIDLSTIPVAAWRSHIAWVPQNPYLFNASLGENLKLGNPSAAHSDLEQVCRKAGLAEFISTLPDGLDTPIGEGGLRLSGGQAQRLALARTFLMPAELYLLDEAVAGLDPEAALELSETLANIPPNKTVLAITHHPGGINAFDRVLSFSDGRLMSDFTSADYPGRPA